MSTCFWPTSPPRLQFGQGCVAKPLEFSGGSTFGGGMRWFRPLGPTTESLVYYRWFWMYTARILMKALFHIIPIHSWGVRTASRWDHKDLWGRRSLNWKPLPGSSQLFSDEDICTVMTCCNPPVPSSFGLNEIQKTNPRLTNNNAVVVFSPFCDLITFQRSWQLSAAAPGSLLSCALGICCSHCRRRQRWGHPLAARPWPVSFQAQNLPSFPSKMRQTWRRSWIMSLKLVRSWWWTIMHHGAGHVRNSCAMFTKSPLNQSSATFSWRLWTSTVRKSWWRVFWCSIKFV